MSPNNTETASASDSAAADTATGTAVTNGAAEREIHLRTCPLCEAMCGLQIHVEDQEVKLIRPDRDDVWSKGYICPKGTTLGHMHHDPDRLRVPMIREGTVDDPQWREATWDEALARCQELISQTLAKHGKSAFSYYVGNPTVHNYSLGRYIGLFQGLAELEVCYSAGTIDQWPKNVSCRLMYGNSWQIPGPDLPNTDYFVVMGANPHASQGSLLACPDVLGEMDKVRERGGKCVVIDPVRTGTCDHADEWIPIVPGTDAAFLMAIVNTLFAEDLVDLGEVADIINGLDELRELAQDFTPEAVAAATDIPAETTRRLAREIAAAPTAIVYGRIGLCNQEFGTLASWLTDVVNILTANFDTPGGLMFGKPIAPALATLNFEPPSEQEFGTWHSRVRGAPEVLGQVPVSCLSEEIGTPGEGQIKGLLTIAGNPVISSPESLALDEALPQLECMISIDNWLNETTRHAHVILPGLSHLEQPHYDEMIWSWAVRSAGNYSPAIFPPPPERPQEWELLARIAGYLAGLDDDSFDLQLIDDGFLGALCAQFDLESEKVLAVYAEGPEELRGGPERMNDFMIRVGPWGDRFGENPDGLTLQDFKDNPHGIDKGPMVPRVRELLHTTSGKVELSPKYITDDLPRLQERIDQAQAQVDAASSNGQSASSASNGQVAGAGSNGLVLVSRRHVRSNNSWMHNVKVLVKGKDRCTLLIHPQDAERTGVSDGSLAKVSSEAGSVEVPVEVTENIKTGVVSLPHGWGHNKPGTRLSVASEHAGVNNNELAPGTLVDKISGNAAVNGIPVEVVPA